MNASSLKRQRRPMPAGLSVVAGCLGGLMSLAAAYWFGSPVAPDLEALTRLTHDIDSLERDRQSLALRLTALGTLEAVPLAHLPATPPVAELETAKRVVARVPVLRITQREVSRSAARLEHLQRLHASGRVDESVRLARAWRQSDALDASVSDALDRLILRSGYALRDGAVSQLTVRARRSESTP